jgi:hypothetical protein
MLISTRYTLDDIDIISELVVAETLGAYERTISKETNTMTLIDNKVITRRLWLPEA